MWRIFRRPTRNFTVGFCIKENEWQKNPMQQAGFIVFLGLKTHTCYHFWRLISCPFWFRLSSLNRKSENLWNGCFYFKWTLKQSTKNTASCWELFHAYNVKSHTWCAMVQFDRWWISELCACEKIAVVLLSLSDFRLTQFDDMESAGSRPKDDVSLPKGMEPIKPLCCKWLL